MPYALMSSGGKDSTLALHRAMRQGLDVRYFVNIYNAETGRVAFHGTRSELIAAQAEALGLELIAVATGPEPYEAVFVDVVNSLVHREVTGVVFGNVHLADVRAWFEERIGAAGLDHIEPIWGMPPAAVVREVIDAGFRATVVSVDLEQAPAELLGGEVDDAFATLVANHPAMDACGERGEYHTYVHDGPNFHHPVHVSAGKQTQTGNHRFIDLTMGGSE